VYVQGEFHLYSDRWLIQKFAENAWSAVNEFSLKVHPVRAIAVERPVFWPFGIHTDKGGWKTTRKGCGMPYDTRIDLVCETVPSDTLGVWPVIVEFKTKMERAASTPVNNYLLMVQKDCLQPVLNAWMYFLETWQLPKWAVLLYATRRHLLHHFSDEELGCRRSSTGYLDFHEAVKQPWCKKIISEFAFSAFGNPGSRGRYVDDNFLVVDVGALREATLWHDKDVFNELTGCMYVFETVLKDSRLQSLIRAAEDGLTAEQILRTLGRPVSVSLPLGTRVLTGRGKFGRINRLSRDNLQELNDRWKTCQLDPKESYPTDNLKYSSEKIEWAPIVFNDKGCPIMFCNTKGSRITFIIEGDAVLSLSHNLVPALPVGRNVFRCPSLITMVHPLYRPKSAAGTQSARMQLALNASITKAASDVWDRLSLAATGVDPVSFFSLTVDNVFRSNLTSGGPAVREFVSTSTRDYAMHASHEKNTGSHKHVSVIRCVNRLLNARVLRAIFALHGISDLHYERVVDKSLWSEGDLEVYRNAEFGALRDMLDSVDEGDDVVTPSSEQHDLMVAWWGQSRYDGFVHMSQRAAWTTEALGCALATLEIEGSTITVVEAVADQVHDSIALALSQISAQGHTGHTDKAGIL
jgi:hypothetical protein